MGTAETQGSLVCVVIPTFNEAENITALLEEVRAFNVASDMHIVVVDDNSADGKNASLSFTAATGGVFTVEVLAVNGGGDYRLMLAVVDDDVETQLGDSETDSEAIFNMTRTKGAA